MKVQQKPTNSHAASNEGWNRELTGLKAAVSKIAFVIFNAYAFILSPVMWGIGLGIGLCFKREVKERITDFFGSVMYSHLSWQLALPAAGLMYWLCLPGMLVIQGIMAGAAFGSKLAYSAEDLIKNDRNVLYLLKC